MGLWDILTKPIGGSGLSWNEPFMFRIRLRGDLWIRLVTMLGVWLAATGVMLVLFTLNNDPPGIGIALGLGAVFGLGPAALCLFVLRDHVSGRVIVDKRCLRRRTTYAGFTGQWGEESVWEFGAITRCVFVSGDEAGLGYSLLVLSDGETTDVAGLPARLDVESLCKQLRSRGVEVRKSASVPERLRKPLPVYVAAIAGAVGLGLACGGLAFYLLAK